jgi:hypothetical protein
MIRDAAWHPARHPAAASVPPERGAEWAPRVAWLAPSPIEVAMLAPTAKDEDVHVVVNHGRWVVECPDCHGAQLACRTDLRFMCNECGNISISGEWRAVVWPAQADAIDAELAKRPRVVNQHWLPGETLADLQLETTREGRVLESPPVTPRRKG